MASATSPPAPGDPAARLSDAARLATLRAAGLMDSPGTAVLDRLTRLASRLTGAPVALVSLVDDCRQYFASQIGLPQPWADQRQTPLSHSFCQYVVISDEPLVIGDAREHDLLRTNLAIPDIGVVAYAGFPLRSPRGQTLGSFCVIDTEPREWGADELTTIEDLAAAAEAEIAVRLSHADVIAESRRTQAILEAATDAFVSADEHGHVRAWNPAAERLFGYKELEALGRPLTELIIPERFREAHDAGLARVRRSGSSHLAGQRLDLVAHDRAGREFPVEMTLQAHAHEGVLQFHAFLHDISERTAHVRAVADSETRFRSLFELSPIGMALVSLDGTWQRVNPAFATITGYPVDELQRLTYQDITHPGDLDADLRQVGRLIDGEINDYQHHKRYVRKDGTVVWCLLSVVMMRDALEQPSHFLCQIVDVDAERRTQELLDVTFASSPDLHLLTTLDGTVVRANDAWERVLGWSEAELRERGALSLVHPDDLPEGTAVVRRATQEQSVTAVNRFRARDGSYRWLQWHGAALHDQGLIVASARDITEDITSRRRAEELTARETERLRTTIAVQREVAAAAADPDTALRLIAERALAAIPDADGAAVGLVDRDQLRVSTATGSLSAHADARVPLAGSLTGHALRSGTTVRSDDTDIDPRADRDSCRALGVRSMIVAPLTGGGSPLGVLTMSNTRPHAFDDTDAQQLTLLADALSGALAQAGAAARLQSSEARFRSAFDNCPLGMVLTSLAPHDLGTVLQANAAMATITGRGVADLIGRRVHEYHHPDELAETDRLIARLREGAEETFTGAKRYRHADGHTVWVQVHIAVVRNEHGEPLHLVTQVEDVTERRAIDEQLRQRAQLLDLTQDAVIVRELDGQVVYWNPAAERIYGWPAQIAVGHDLDRLLGTTWQEGLTRPAVNDILLAEGEWEGELEHRRADGRKVTILSRKALQRDPDGRPAAILSINTDITARRAAEQALRSSEQRFRSQFAHSAIGQIIRGADDRIQEVNPAFAAMVGVPPENLVGTLVADHLAPDALLERTRSLATLFAGRADSYQQECRLVRAGGDLLDVHITVSAVRDDHGHPERFVCIVQDISDRKTAEAARDAAIAELADHNRQLKAANQLKQDLIGMLGHELGNPLAAILAHTETLTDDWDVLGARRQRDMLQVIDRKAHQLDDIVREVLAMVTLDAGKLTATPTPVRVADHLDIPSVRVACPPDLTVLVQPSHLDQILANLISNAAKYAGGATAITATREDDQATIAVRDAGPGVPDDLRPHLFDRFTRATGTATTVKGTGLGLHIVRELARANGGDIHYSPAPGGGSLFVVTLPTTT